MKVNKVIIDEGAFVSNDIAAPLFPSLLNKNCSFLMITTPSQSPNQIFSAMMEKPIKFMKVLLLSDRCDDCVKKEKTKCYHWAHRVAPWKTGESLELVSAMMNAYTSSNRELSGVETTDGVHLILGRDHIEYLQNCSWYNLFSNSDYPYVVMGVDPSPGGHHSHYAVTLGLVDQYVFVVRYVLFIHSLLTPTRKWNVVYTNVMKEVMEII